MTVWSSGCGCGIGAVTLFVLRGSEKILKMPILEKHTKFLSRSNGRRRFGYTKFTFSSDPLM
ncbi:hypothetical protein RSAG8_04048, partial [Rhizoctonia solani AG-8 WAC10335]